MAARGHSGPKYRSQKTTFGNGHSQRLYRHMKAMGYAGWLAASLWRIPDGVCVAKRYWVGKRSVGDDWLAAKSGYLRTCPSARMTPSNERLSD